MSILFYLKRNFILNEAFGSWEYQVPVNREKLIYDFYLLSYLNPDKFGDDERMMNLKIAIKEAKDKITLELIKILKNTIFIAVSSELFHYPERLIIDDRVDEIKSKLNQKEKIFFQFIENESVDKINKLSYDQKSEMIKDFLNKQNISLIDFYNFAVKAFSDEDGWFPQYGGKLWAMIAKSGIRLIDLQNKSINERQIWIDHALDLHHNTNSVTTKDNSWAKNGLDRFKMKKVLDKKKDIQDVSQYYTEDLVSQQLKEPFAFILKNVYNKTIQSYQKDKDTEEVSKYVYGKYELKDGVANVQGDVKFPKDFNSKGGFPVKFGIVNGDFRAETYALSHLNNSPTKVTGNFNVSKNVLESLIGGPKYVGGNFLCSNNYLDDLQGAPEEVDGTFDCSHNLFNRDFSKGIPKKVGGHFIISKINNMSEEEMIQEIKSKCQVGGNVDII